MSGDDDPGVPAFVTFGWKPPGQGDGLQPQRVRHASLPVAWHVTEILDSWEYPGHSGETSGQLMVKSWWLLKVYGPAADPPHTGVHGPQRRRPPDRPAGPSALYRVPMASYHPGDGKVRCRCGWREVAE